MPRIYPAANAIPTMRDEDDEREGEDGDPFAHAGAPSHRAVRRLEVGEEVERARHENRLAELVRATHGGGRVRRPPRRRAKCAPRVLGERGGRERRGRSTTPSRRTGRPSEARTAEHLVDVLVAQDRGADRVVGAGEVRAEPARRRPGCGRRRAPRRAAARAGRGARRRPLRRCGGRRTPPRPPARRRARPARAARAARTCRPAGQLSCRQYGQQRASRSQSPRPCRRARRCARARRS